MSGRNNRPPDAVPTAELAQMLHELRVHQIELEMQKDDVLRKQMELDTSSSRYFDLYEMAPAGYCTISEAGLILQTNLKTAALLGVARGALIKQAISLFIFKEDQDLYYLLNKRLAKIGQPQSCELRLVKHDGTLCWVYLVAAAANDESGAPALSIVLSDITERKQVEENQRIAAIAFECQEGMAVMDAKSQILRVNRAFTQITGYSQQEAQGKTSAILRSDRHPASFYEGNWSDARRDGLWQGELWFRRKSGEDFPAQVTVTAVMDEINQITHYVGNLTDATDSHRLEQKRLANEADQRDTLIREVHHRIKNNLQGIIGMLRQFALQHPDTAQPITQAIGQVQGISVIHGLRGRADPSSVRLCELTSAIAAEVSALWQTPVKVDIPSPWAVCPLAEQEAVPMALVLNELIVNAVKHGGKAHGDTCVSLRKGQHPDSVLTTISNTGTLPTGAEREAKSHAGLKLVRSLLPRSGATLRQTQVAHQVVTELEVRPPVISMKKDNTS